MALKEAKVMWDLCLALWGRLRGIVAEEEQDGETRLQRGPDSHEVTMLRREAVSEWLREVVSPSVREDVRRAKMMGNTTVGNVEQILAHLSGNDVSEACNAAHRTGNHYAALVTASAAGGGAASVNGELVLQQLEGYQQMRADRHIGQSVLRLYGLVSGMPEWRSSDGARDVNVCADLDWKRALAAHLWFLASPVASVADAFVAYEAAAGVSGSGTGDDDGDENLVVSPYASSPRPEHDPQSADYLDVKYHLLRLYTRRSHSLESVLNPATHTADPLDHRTSWLLGRVLGALGYSHLAPERREQVRVHCGYCTGWSISSDSLVGLTLICIMFHHLAQLFSHFCQFAISLGRTRQRVEQSKSKSTQPSYPSRWPSLYIDLSAVSSTV